jgi:hypothetical protein
MCGTQLGHPGFTGLAGGLLHDHSRRFRVLYFQFGIRPGDAFYSGRKPDEGVAHGENLLILQGKRFLGGSLTAPYQVPFLLSKLVSHQALLAKCRVA